MQARTLPRRKHWFYSLFLLVISVAIIELVSFGLCRYVFHFQTGNHSQRHLYSVYRGHKLNPNFRASSHGGHKIHSSDGFRRATAVAVEKPEHVFRVLMLGGSTLYGLGSGGGRFIGEKKYPDHPDLLNHETIDHFLEDRLQKAFREQYPAVRFEVINAGVTAYHTFQHLIYLNESLYAYSPDIVICLDGHNDFYIDSERYNPWRDYEYSSVGLVGAFNERGTYFSSFVVVRSLARISYFFTLMERATNTIWSPLQRKSTQQTTLGEGQALNGRSHQHGYTSVAKNTFMRAYGQIQALADQYGFKFMVFLQPEIVFEKQTELSDADKHIRKVTIEQANGVNSITHWKRARVGELMAMKGFEYYDVGEIANEATSNKQLYIDYCHLTPLGSEVVADRIYGHVLPAVKRLVAQRFAGRESP